MGLWRLRRCARDRCLKWRLRSDMSRESRDDRKTKMARPRSLTVIAGLALTLGILGGLAGLLWLQIVSIFDQGSGVMSSLIVMMAEAKGWLLIALALMYLLFAAGAWQVRGCAWHVGVLGAVLTL